MHETAARPLKFGRYTALSSEIFISVIEASKFVAIEVESQF